ncbi:MAG: CapA family protein [Desulfuromonadales bacterium]|nr:CapA family protein [Desulfuromonadales bacterium]
MTTITLFLCGDVMTGRGIDQVLPHPGDPQLHERYVKTAEAYVELAEEANGPVPRPVPFAYPWGEALAVLAAENPDLRLANLETAVTQSQEWWPGKGIHYRMSPRNAPCLAAAGLQACTLANNHLLDWGRGGLTETLAVLHRLGIATAGAGANARQAQAPAVLPVPGKGRVLLFAAGTGSSGIPPDWEATAGRAGVYRLSELSMGTLRRLSEQVAAVRKPGDIAVVSLHWGGNWGYAIPPEHQAFARGLVEAGVDLVHGHSAHHLQGIEVYRGKLILYGCGDFLTDYEGISGHQAFRSDLGLMYFPQLAVADGRLLGLRLIPTRMRRLQLQRASAQEAAWLRQVLNREGERLQTRVEEEPGGALRLRWS